MTLDQLIDYLERMRHVRPELGSVPVCRPPPGRGPDLEIAIVDIADRHYWTASDDAVETGPHLVLL